jgi:hypothetical protein
LRIIDTLFSYDLGLYVQNFYLFNWRNLKEAILK